MLSRLGRLITRRKNVVVRLGRWDPHRSDENKMRIAELADHDGCGAHQCAKPAETQLEDSDVMWYVEHGYATGGNISSRRSRDENKETE